MCSARILRLTRQTLWKSEGVDNLNIIGSSLKSANNINIDNGFNSGFDDNGDKLSINISSANVSFEGGKLSFNVGNASLILNFTGSSADLIEDNNFISESADLGEISLITYEQGDYQFGEENWTLASGQNSLVSAQ